MRKWVIASVRKTVSQQLTLREFALPCVRDTLWSQLIELTRTLRLDLLLSFNCNVHSSSDWTCKLLRNVFVLGMQEQAIRLVCKTLWSPKWKRDMSSLGTRARRSIFDHVDQNVCMPAHLTDLSDLLSRISVPVINSRWRLIVETSGMWRWSASTFFHWVVLRWSVYCFFCRVGFFVS